MIKKTVEEGWRSISGMRSSCSRGQEFNPALCHYFRHRSDRTLNRGLVFVRMLDIKICTLKILTFIA